MIVWSMTTNQFKNHLDKHWVELGNPVFIKEEISCYMQIFVLISFMKFGRGVPEPLT